MTPVQETDSLSSLEDRITRAVELVAQLRREREAAAAEAAQAKAEGEAARAEAARLAETVRTLEAERKQVRGRIEKLLSQIDQLSVP